MRPDHSISSRHLPLAPWFLLAVLLAGPTYGATQNDRPVEPAPPSSRLDAADTALGLTCTMLALGMTPALGLFYAGMVRRKNALATFQQSFVLAGALAIHWVLIGYSLAFGPGGIQGLIGGLSWFGLRGVGLEPIAAYTPTTPHQLFALFQLAIATFAAALISGAIVERTRFGPFLILAILWTTLVYDPVAHWVMAPEGWLKRTGLVDYGGGLSVHLSAGISAMSCAWVVGVRKGFGTEIFPPHNLLLTAIGATLLGAGWMGWNAGNSQGANASAVAALFVTVIAAGASMVSWAAIESLFEGRSTGLGLITGYVAGLVAITPAAGSVNPLPAMALGLGVSPLCYAAMRIKRRLGVDDSLDVLAVHGIGGAVGILGVGMLARPGDPAHPPGLIYGKTDLLLTQVMGLGAVALYSGLVTLGLAFVVDRICGLRARPEHEELGLDLAEHGERVYILSDRELVGAVKESA